jgi:hypothetical protein
MSQMLTALLRCLQKIMLIPRVAHYFINHAVYQANSVVALGYSADSRS